LVINVLLDHRQLVVPLALDLVRDVQLVAAVLVDGEVVNSLKVGGRLGAALWVVVALGPQGFYEWRLGEEEGFVPILLLSLSRALVVRGHLT